MQTAAIVEQRAWSEPGARHLEVHSFLRKLAGMLGAWWPWHAYTISNTNPGHCSESQWALHRWLVHRALPHLIWLCDSSEWGAYRLLWVQLLEYRCSSLQSKLHSLLSLLESRDAYSPTVLWHQVGFRVFVNPRQSPTSDIKRPQCNPNCSNSITGNRWETHVEKTWGLSLTGLQDVTSMIFLKTSSHILALPVVHGWGHPPGCASLYFGCSAVWKHELRTKAPLNPLEPTLEPILSLWILQLSFGYFGDQEF